MLTATYTAISTILETDTSLSESDKEVIRAVCQNPGKSLTEQKTYPNSVPRLLSLKEVGQILGLSKSGVRRLMNEGQIRSFQILG